MTDIYESLEKLGLTRNEVTIYKYLLRKGVSTGAQIWAENSLDKSSAYRAIGQLQEKRLIYAIGETRNQKFTAYPVEALIELHNKVEKNLSNVRDDIDKFVVDINEYAKENYKSSRIQLFEGEEGYKLFVKQRLSGHVDLMRQLGSAVPVTPDYLVTLSDFMKDRVKREIPIRILIGDEVHRIEAIDKSDLSALKETRQVKGMLSKEVGIVTHGDSVSIFTREDGKFLGLVIKDRLITSAFNMMYDILWNSGKSI
jgi:sugar-specific transcriptional regulator TrmB